MSTLGRVEDRLVAVEKKLEEVLRGLKTVMDSVERKPQPTISLVWKEPYPEGLEKPPVVDQAVTTEPDSYSGVGGGV